MSTITVANINASYMRFTTSHEWVMDHKDDTVTVEITDHAQEQLGDTAYAEFSEEDREIRVGNEHSLVESVKAASGIYAPTS